MVITIIGIETVYEFSNVEKYKYYALFGNYLWKLNEDEYLFNDEELRLILLDTLDREKRKLERLENRYSETRENNDSQRKPIPEKVKMFVWQRDHGKCVYCGTNENLEFDHIIPVSKGGSNTARNIQILCEKCNREKSDNI